MLRLAVLASIWSIAATCASAVTLTVDGTDAIYGAGLTGNGVSTAPAEYMFSAAAGNYIEFSSVTGVAGCCGGSPTIGPDGAGGATTITALNGISGISVNRRIFLAGVFIDSSAPPVSGNQPASLSYGVSPTVGDTSFSPLLNQAFFIGDGLTGTGAGSIQKFFAPSDSDKLLLGLIDGFAFSGTPSFYGDNPGQFRATFELKNDETPGGVVPLPATGWMLIAGLGGIALAKRRKK